MAVEDEKPETGITSKPVAHPSNVVLETASSQPHRAPSPADLNPIDLSPKKAPSPRDCIFNVTSNIASQPLQNSDPQVWGVLTAISNCARKRQQGINMILTADEHCIGRLAGDVRFQINSNSVSANHCRIYRTRITNENMESTMSIFLKDTSMNGTYLNWERLKKNSGAVKVCHGDIISFAAPPEHDMAYAFVYREVVVSDPIVDRAGTKRKADELISENKKLKGIGIGAPEGPISLDDFRSLQKSNMELRKQLENLVVLIDTMHNENHAAAGRHESELKEASESVAKCYLDQLKELRQMVDLKQKELGEVNRLSAEQKHALEDLDERLSTAMQSCSEANAIISSQKVNIAELKEQLDEERSQRKEEREKAATDIKAAIHRVQSEAQEELKCHSNAAFRRETELQEAIKRLQESERERSILVETLRSKLEDTRQKLVVSDNKVRQLETQVHEEQLASANRLKRVEELEQAMRRLTKELESEKAVREEAWAKVSVLELEINAAVRDLDFEKQRLKGAWERLMLRETQLRAFYSTTEEIQVLFSKQQEQLKAMQRTLEDEENYENSSVDMDGVVDRTAAQEKEVAEYHGNNAAKEGSATSAQKFDRDQIETSSDEVSDTEKHDCGMRSQECQDTQEVEFTSADNDQGVQGGFGSGTAGIDTLPMMEGDTEGTEQVLETESLANYGEKKFHLNQFAVERDTVQFDGDTIVHETEELGQTACLEVVHQLQSNNLVDTQKTNEDIEAGGGVTIRTADLLASEIAGSWACDTAPSVHGENESPRCRDNNVDAIALHNSNAMVAESQSTASHTAAARQNHGRHALSEMIGIVASDLREHFGGSADGCDERIGQDDNSPALETAGCSDTGDDNGVNAKGVSISDAETEDGDRFQEFGRQDETMDEDDEDIREDSFGTEAVSCFSGKNWIK